MRIKKGILGAITGVMIWSTTCSTLSAQDHVSDKNLQITLGLTGEQNYYIRTKALTRIGTRLSEPDIDAIYRWLDTRTAPELKPLEFNSLKNDLVIVLLRQKHSYDRLAAALIEMAQNPDHALIWRCYCIQFMGRTYPDVSAEIRARYDDALQVALESPLPDMAGTALIAVNLNQCTGTSPIPTPFLVEKSLQMLEDKRTPDHVKVTCLQIAAENKSPHALAKAREILNEPEESSIQLRMSAAAAVGLLGDTGDLANLDTIAASADIRLRYSALAAKDKINQRYQ